MNYNSGFSNQSFSFFNQNVKGKEYLPDSVYSLCDETSDCTICSNVVYSPVVDGFVRDSQNGKVFCPFGMEDSMNTHVYGDQQYLVRLQPNKYTSTTWGRAPQLDPRPLAKIGLEWRTS